MSEDAKDSSGLFRIKDLEAMELEEEELFPTDEHEVVATGLVSEGAAEEMVAAIRRARHDVTGPQESLDELIGLAHADGIPADDDAEQDAGPVLPELHAQRSTAVFQTDETKAVIQAAADEMDRRRLRTAAIIVGVPIILLAITLVAAWSMLYRTEPISDATFPVQELEAQGIDSPLAVVGMITVPEPEPEEDVETDEERERRERRERRRRRRERERDEPTIDRDSLF